VDGRLLSILACPWCLGGLKRTGERLKCAKCGAVYSIRDGIPNMRVEEADLFCPRCSAALEKRGRDAACATCGRRFRMDARLATGDSR
jgi:uncharacterized protein YbaR (Trm112 family)